MNLKYTNENDKFSFHFHDNSGNNIAVSDWGRLQAEFLSQLAILTELHDNGLADYTENSCEIESRDVLRLSEIDQQILDLPNGYPYEIFVESEGTLTHNSFKFKYGFYDFAPNGTRLETNRNGAIIKIEESEYLLSENQYQLCRAIDEFNTLLDNEKGNVVNLKKLSELKSLSKESGLTLEHFLNNQELFIPEKIKLDIDFNNGVLEILPSIEIENAIGFNNIFDKLPMVRDVYPVSGNNGETTRVVISESQKLELQKVKAIRKVSDRETIQEIIEHPELFFDEENVDFTVFYSDRVKEIGVYTPKVYPFASPYKSQWIPGILIKDKVHGEKKIYFKTPEKLNDFIEQKEIAVKEKKQTVEWENAEIPIEDAEKFIITAKKQFETPNKPVKQEKKNDHEVLIIKENIDELEFVQNGKLNHTLKLAFSEIQNLKLGLELKHHQKIGISWLQTLYKKNCPGGLLGDDMGLGKTLQLLYFIEWHCQNFDDNKPYLIVAPVSLLENWENEYQKFFSPQNLPLCKLYGGVSLTKENNTIKNQQDAKELQFKQIILTNYETLRSYQISLGLVDFAVIALDEAQKIKTPGTLVEKASKAMKAGFRIAMTGTPVENTLVDIWSIMDFVYPGLLGTIKEFVKEFQNQLGRDGIDQQELTDKLRKRIGDFLLRRLKKDVAKDLPTKHDNEKSRIKKIMPPIQLERYKQEIELANNSELKGVEKSNQKLKSIWAIRDISDHPYLVDKKTNEYQSEEEIKELIKTSAKLQTTLGILAEIKYKEEKAIIFADRKETQRMIQNVIRNIYGFMPSIINGDTPTKKQNEGKQNLSRQQTIDYYQSQDGFNVIIMSPIAAGVGLNVTKANHIIHYTRHWNPAKEEQATDRAYRIGQQKDVFVHYPMAIFPDDMKDEEGNKLKSFDEILDTLLNNKKTLASNALFPTEQAELSPDELFENIFGNKTDSKPEIQTIKDIDRLNPNLFEATIGALYQKQGFQVYLTPYSNDKGVDVVILKNGDNYLIQAKQTKSLVGNGAIQEICTAKKYYEDKFKEKFKLLTITNNNYSSSAVILAKSNDIELINRENLMTLVIQNSITINDIHKIESQRMTRI